MLRALSAAQVDGYMVLKLNDYTLEDGEPSVFGTEVSAKPTNKAPAGPLRKGF